MDSEELEKIRAKFGEMDKLLYAAEKDFLALNQLEQILSRLTQYTKVLEEFYHSEEWLEGRELIRQQKDAADYFYCAGEDPIYNLTQDFFAKKVQLIQHLAASLT